MPLIKCPDYVSISHRSSTSYHCQTYKKWYLTTLIAQFTLVAIYVISGPLSCRLTYPSITEENTITLSIVLQKILIFVAYGAPQSSRAVMPVLIVVCQGEVADTQS